MTFAVYALILSLFSGSFGMTKFFVKGPLPILPQKAPLGGVLSAKFLTLLLLNTMFVIRTFCLEASFFTSYRVNNLSPISNIDPLIPEEYRLVIYILPGLLSVLINVIKLAFSMTIHDFSYFKKFPQFIICPMFCPLMFEGNRDRRSRNETPVRVWKIGSILNAIFMGCLPQFLLFSLEHYRDIPSWYQTNWSNENNALIKHGYGNSILSITSFLLFLILTITFFGWDRLFHENGLLCSIRKKICPSCLNCCSKPQQDEMGSSDQNSKDDSEKGNELSNRDPAIPDKVTSSESEEADEEVLTTYQY